MFEIKNVARHFQNDILCAILSCVKMLEFVEAPTTPVSRAIKVTSFRETEINRVISRSVPREREKSGKCRLDVEGRRSGRDSSESFSDARAHARYVSAGRSGKIRRARRRTDCRRSAVDDNGNPIFRNNICFEDRRD